MLTMQTRFGPALIAAFLFVSGDAYAQASSRSTQSADEYPWSLEFGLGVDNSISGNINSSGIGTLNNQAVVVLANPYEDVYGTGFHLRFGGGYMLDERSEVRVMFTYQSLDAELTPMGDIGPSNLYGQYDDYKSFGMDVGYRRYFPVDSGTVRFFGEGTIGLAFISEIDVVLVAPEENLTRDATDFYDRTGAITLGLNGGVLFGVASQADLSLQLGVRFVSGLSTVDGLRGTGLEDINDNSGRWTLPFVVAIRVHF